MLDTEKQKEKSKDLSFEKIIHSSWRIFNSRLFEELESMDNVSDLQLLLTVIASYYVNWEEFPAWRTANLTVKFINSLLKKGKLDLNTNINKGYGAHLAYIRRHLNLYYETRNFWKLYFSGEKILKEMLLNVWKRLYKFKNFRNWIVSHGPGAKLSEKLRLQANMEWNNELLHSNSNFVFPPANYILSLLNKLDEKLKQPDIGVYKKAAYVGSYVFLTHPFFDGNSRTSRIMMISFLDHYDKKFIKLYTFLTAFTKDLPSYDDFLQLEIYPLFERIRSKVKISTFKNEEGKLITDVVQYPSLEEYEQIMEEAADKLYKRLIKVSKYIYENIEKINVLLRLVSLPSKLKGEEKVLWNYFLENTFKLLKEKGLHSLEENIYDVFTLSDSFIKRNKIEPDVIKKVKLLFTGILNTL